MQKFYFLTIFISLRKHNVIKKFYKCLTVFQRIVFMQCSIHLTQTYEFDPAIENLPKTAVKIHASE